ncbi:hypothetical protein AJ79_09405 [Helicocarpus griseus UAMH5409]|uniref:Anaphase-promoting complex subunit 11 n=1 Tax=Helicocarpus griseus UAMH5409 TaxID=1447875 RepID=A0A2B7WJZ8_9EURO|nr:hypothetical protein AJ79_09405 [Helicocarpus griseus UAMH5409]
MDISRFKKSRGHRVTASRFVSGIGHPGLFQVTTFYRYNLLHLFKLSNGMKVTLKEWNAVATWRWDMPEDEVCGICRVQFDGTCPTCKFPGDDCSLLIGKCGHSFHMHCLLTWIGQESSKGLCPMCRQSRGLCFGMASPNHPDPLPTSAPKPPSRQQTHAEDNTPLPKRPERNDGVGHIQENSHPESPRQPPFRPFFTLIQDANTSEYYHPTVHYIFSDDDTDIITEAALRSLESDPANSSLRGSGNSNGHAHLRQHEEAVDVEDDPADVKASMLPPPVPGVQEHYIVLDIQPSQPGPTPPQPAADPNTNTNPAGGANPNPNPAPARPPTTTTDDPPTTSTPHPYTITAAHSLSPTWQVLNTRLGTAPTFDSTSAAADRSSSPVGGLMLEIEGTAGVNFNTSSQRLARGGQSLEEMIGQFEKRMGELRRVIEAGEVETFEGDKGIGAEGGQEPVGVDEDNLKEMQQPVLER